MCLLPEYLLSLVYLYLLTTRTAACTADKTGVQQEISRVAWINNDKNTTVFDFPQV